LKINKEKLFLEHHTRKFLLSVFLIRKLDFLYKSGNVYDALGRFFGFESIDKTFQLSEVHPKSKVLIFPDSRKKHKVINVETMRQLTTNLTNLNVEFKIAKFGHINYDYNNLQNQLVYSDFKDLILLISECDFVISSDSVPVHRAEFLEKQHIILYNDKINFNWLTPFAKKNHMFTTFKETPIFINKYFN
jgi:ADP-heptose:LPS heptosyltransferase